MVDKIYNSVWDAVLQQGSHGRSSSRAIASETATAVTEVATHSGSGVAAWVPV
jgi:hypothetical protein